MVKQLILVLIVFTIYVGLGGWFFMLLEASHETEMRKELKQARVEWQTMVRVLFYHNFTEIEITETLHKIGSAEKHNLVNEQFIETETNWGYYNSIFFVLTLITTVGYGNLSPATALGRIFCMIYATIGIPLTAITLGLIGDRFSRRLQSIMKNAKLYHTSRMAIACYALSFYIPWFIVFLVIPAAVFTYTENWSFLEGIYYCLITLATIGFGDYVAGTMENEYFWAYKTAVLLWLIFGLAFISMILNFIRNIFLTKALFNLESQILEGFKFTLGKIENSVDNIDHKFFEYKSKESEKLTGRINQVEDSTDYSSINIDDETKRDLEQLELLIKGLKAETGNHIRELIHRRIYQLEEYSEATGSNIGPTHDTVTLTSQ